MINTINIGRKDVLWSSDEFMKHFNAKPVAAGFKYNSGENIEWETVESLREKIKTYVNPEFTV
jgi:hypothetical protein